MLEVPVTLSILTGDSQKLSFSTLKKEPSWFFDQTNSVNAKLLPTKLVAKLVRGLCGQKFSMDRECTTLMKFRFLKSSWKIVWIIHHPAKLDEFFFKSGYPYYYVHVPNDFWMSLEMKFLESCIIKNK